LAHRVAYTLSVGEIPEGLEVGHECDNRGCVRPSHLVACTHRQNFEDGKKRGRIVKKLDWVKVREIRESLESHAELARRFNCNQEMIRRVRLNTKWPDEEYQVNCAHFRGLGHRKGRG
jgi:hypothetical protein